MTYLRPTYRRCVPLRSMRNTKYRPLISKQTKPIINLMTTKYPVKLSWLTRNVQHPYNTMCSITANKDEYPITPFERYVELILFKGEWLLWKKLSCWYVTLAELRQIYMYIEIPMKHDTLNNGYLNLLYHLSGWTFVC